MLTSNLTVLPSHLPPSPFEPLSQSPRSEHMQREAEIREMIGAAQVHFPRFQSKPSVSPFSLRTR